MRLNNSLPWEEQLNLNMPKRNSEEWQISSNSKLSSMCLNMCYMKWVTFLGYWRRWIVFVCFFSLRERERVSMIWWSKEKHTCVCCGDCWNKEDRKERAGPQKGKPEPSGVVAVGFVRKASAFSPKMILLSAILDCLYLLPLVSEWTENCQTGPSVLNFFDLLLWGSFAILAHWGGGDHRDE